VRGKGKRGGRGMREREKEREKVRGVRWWAADVPVAGGNRGVEPRGWGLSLLEASESGVPKRWLQVDKHHAVSVPDSVRVGADVGEVRGGGPPAKHLYDVIRDSLA